MTVDCPLSPFTALYRVLRTDESCDNGLIAKNPLADPSDAGGYVCMATNIAGQDTAATELTVHGKWVILTKKGIKYNGNPF